VLLIPGANIIGGPWVSAPFCVHPKTGRVCIPMDPAKCESFDPLAVPTVAQLLNELDAAGSTAAGKEAGAYTRPLFSST